MLALSGRQRVFAAVIQDGAILMIHCVDPERDFWTLPGGGIEPGESPEEAVIREVREEANIDVTVSRFLFSQSYRHGEEHCFLVQMLEGQTASPGYDPEVPDMSNRILEVAWFPLDEVKDDVQVSVVLKHL